MSLQVNPRSGQRSPKVSNGSKSELLGAIIFDCQHISGQLGGGWRHVRLDQNLILIYYVYLSGALLMFALITRAVTPTMFTSCPSALGIVATHGVQLLQVQYSIKLQAPSPFLSLVGPAIVNKWATVRASLLGFK